MKRNKLSICLIMAMILPLTGCSSNPILLKSDTITIEYGEKLQDMKEYLETDSMDKEVLEKVTLDSTSLKMDEGKEYPSLGEYTVTYKYEDSTKEMKVKVQDTTKPVFKKFKDYMGAVKECPLTKEDMIDGIVVEDLDKTTLEIDDSQVDYTKVGHYKAPVTVKDTSGNTETKEMEIVVMEPTIKLDKTSKSMYVKESFVLKTDIKGKDDKATFKSSSTSVATVDTNGKVTAKKAGTTTITATANEVEATCKVTVKNAPSGSTTTTKKDSSGNTVTVIKDSGGNSSGGSSSASYTPQLSRDTFNKINALRAENGLPALIWDDTLAQEALVRANELNIYYMHLRPDGSKVKYTEIITGANSSSAAVSKWENSSAHKKIMLNTTQTKCAVAQVKAANYSGNIYVAVFDY